MKCMTDLIITLISVTYVKCKGHHHHHHHHHHHYYNYYGQETIPLVFEYII